MFLSVKIIKEKTVGTSDFCEFCSALLESVMSWPWESVRDQNDEKDPHMEMYTCAGYWFKAWGTVGLTC